MTNHRVLVIGAGGREHVLAWALARSTHVEKVYIAPGNAGTALVGENVPIGVDDIAGLVNFAKDNQIALTVVGPEAPLAAGLVDAFQFAGLKIFGPNKAAAQLEASKIFAKEFMDAVGIPTAEYASFDDIQAARQFLRVFGRPVVVKADGLAAGKGVMVCETLEEAEVALVQCMEQKAFGAAGAQVVIEEQLEGREISVLVFTDGKTIVPMPLARDHKRIDDGDEGPNTGGMGAFAPATDISADLLDEILETVLEPAIEGMAERGTPYRGVLYAGLMITPLGPRVLEFNCRFGDPETQVILPLLQTDFFEVCMACVEEKLDSLTVEWSDEACVAVVLAAKGYPEAYPKGMVIQGLDNINHHDDVIVFHAGTTVQNGQVVTSGGRVLAVTALGQNLEDALQKAYGAIPTIYFDHLHYRRDIGKTVAFKNAYAQAGVDIAAGQRAVALMQDAIKATFTPQVLSSVGSFGGLFDVDFLKELARPILVASTDGVGTKTKVAAKLGRWDTIGQDLVNHCINDILVQGARPLFFLDYVASSRLNPETMATVVQGMAKACQEAGCALIGGETAEMPGVYKKGEIDVVGTIVGVVDGPALLTGEGILSGDVILALPSSGLHTNGFSLARSILKKQDWETVHPRLGSSIGEALLAVHRSYLQPIQMLRTQGIEIRGLAHITGGGVIDNLPRILPQGLGATIERGTWTILPIFSLIQALGDVDEREMYHVFNMGLGMLVIVSPSQAEEAQAILGAEVKAVGRIVDGQGVSIQ